MNFDFAHGHTRFVVLHAEPGVVGQVEVPRGGTPEGTEGPGSPEDRGSLFHAVEITISEAGAISGRVIQAFAGVEAVSRQGFADDPRQ
jgi:hypothetical protein